MTSAIEAISAVQRLDDPGGVAFTSCYFENFVCTSALATLKVQSATCGGNTIYVGSLRSQHSIIEILGRHVTTFSIRTTADMGRKIFRSMLSSFLKSKHF